MRKNRPAEQASAAESFPAETGPVVGPSPEDGAEMAPEACRFLNLDGGPFPRVGSNNTRRAEVASYVRRRRRHSARRAAVAVKEGGGQSRKQAGQDLES